MSGLVLDLFAGPGGWDEVCDPRDCAPGRVPTCRCGHDVQHSDSGICPVLDCPWSACANETGPCECPECAKGGAT